MCKHTHARACSPRKLFKIRCSEIASDAIRPRCLPSPVLPSSLPPLTSLLHKPGFHTVRVYSDNEVIPQLLGLSESIGMTKVCHVKTVDRGVNYVVCGRVCYTRQCESFPECLIPECLIVKMSNPKMSNPKMSNPKMSNEVLSESHLKKCNIVDILIDFIIVYNSENIIAKIKGNNTVFNC